MRNVSLALFFFTTFSSGALAQTEYELLFAHLGDGELAGGRIISQFILLNPDPATEAQATITIKDDDGNPLSGIDLDGQILSEGTLDVTIPACGMRILTTDGVGPVTVGSATVISDKPLTGVINFSGAFGAAGVGASERLSGFVAAMIRSATTDTGLAIMNPGTTEVSVDLQLIDQDGKLLATATLTIPMMGHLALFFNQIGWEPEPGVILDLSAFEGLIKGTTTGGQIAATVIQTRPNQFITMPVGSLTQVGASELFFAQFGDGESAGGRIVSQFILLNPDKTMEAHATITIKNNEGDPLSGMHLDGQLLPEGTLDVTIPACGMRILETDGEGPVRVGSATVTSDKPLTGVINFGGAFGAAGVGASQRQSRFVAAMIRNATTNMGLAIMNPESTDVTVDLRLFDKDGNLLARASVTIPTMGHLALFFNQIGWEPETGVILDLSAFEGLIKGTTTGGQIAATVIQTQPGEFVTMPVGPVPDESPFVVFLNGQILTMEPGMPQAQALAVRGATIVGLGSNEQVQRLAGPNAQHIDLQGRTLLPGFVDTHSHPLGFRNFNRLDVFQQWVLEGGVTSIGEPGMSRERLENFLAAIETTDLRIRTSLYLTYNTKCDGLEQPAGWYLDYPPDQRPDQMARILGVKIFADPAAGSEIRSVITSISPACGWAKMSTIIPPLPEIFVPTGAMLPYRGDLLVSTEEMAELIADVQDRGYQVLIHARGDAVLEATLDAIEIALGGGPNVLRHRVDHTDFIRPDQLARFGELGALPIVRGRPNACLLNAIGNVHPFGDAVHGWVRVARSLIDLNPGLPVAWHSDVLAFGRRPIHDLYELVTKRQIDPNDDSIVCYPPDWLAAEAVTVEEALRMMTINGAHALFMEDHIGSLRRGKFADLIILSENPLTMDPGRIVDIDVLMTMVGGEVEHCLPGYESLCPAP